MINNTKLYISNSLNPYENLAKEKYLLDIVKYDECILYLWQNEKTVVIGKNQNAYKECKHQLLAEDGGFLARRLSGGGAVFHDVGNLNFTFLVSSDNYNLEKQLTVIKEACLLSNIEASISGRNDILAQGMKFSGNAFYNSKGKSYHHGTILINANMENMQKYLTPSKAKLEAKGIDSVKSRVINLVELNPDLTVEKTKENMIKAFCKVYKNNATIIENIDEEKINNLKNEYSSWEFLFGNIPPFTLTCSKHFSWGNIEMNFGVKHGNIENCNIFTDSMDWELSKVICDNIINKPFKISTFENELKGKIDDNVLNDIVFLLKEQEI